MARRLWPFALVAALLLAPVWLPLGLITLPRRWLRLVPTAIRPDQQLLNRDPNAYPISVDAVCVIRHGGAVAVVRLEPRSAYRVECDVSFWSDANDFGGKILPDSRSSRLLTTNPFGPNLVIGKWTFGCSVGGETMFWLMRPDATYSVEAFEVERLPSELLWIVEDQP